MRTIWHTFIASGWWIHILVFFCVSIAAAYLHGRFWVRVLKLECSPLSLFSIGLVSILSLEELFCWPIVAYRLSSDLLVWLTAGVVLIPPAASFFIRPTGKKTAPPAAPVLIAAAAVLILAMASSVIQYKPDGDDSFYVSNVALFSQAERINLFDSSMGDVTTGTAPMYDFQIWESLMSVICRLFHLKATVVMHTLSVAPLIFLSASAYFCLGRALFHEDNKALFFTIVITIVHLGCKYAGESEGAFLLNRIWQGKSVNLTVIFPLLTAETVNFFSSEEKRPPVLIWLCVLAGVAVNPTSLYVNGFELLFLSLSMALATKQFRRLPALLPAVLITAAFTLLIYLRTKSCVGIIENSSSVGPSFFMDAAVPFFKDTLAYFVLYLLSMLYILIRGDRDAKACFLISGLFMLVFLWNPVSGRFVAEKITKEPTYWRVFWLVPVGAGIAWAATHIAFSVPKRYGLPTAAALLALVVCTGSWHFSEYAVAENAEKISPPVKKIVDSFRSDPVRSPVLACKGIATVMRQENTEVWLLVSRLTYIKDIYLYFGRTEEGLDRLTLFDFVNNDLEDCSAVPELLDKYGVERVIISRRNKTAIALLEEEGWILRQKAGSYRHYERSPG